jgi:hypothetical protein
MHEVNLLDIDIDLGDVMPVAEVIDYLRALPGKGAVRVKERRDGELPS